ncbi:MAG: hypothetical protein NUV35_01905 [Syntrophomonadaceae bacterium]|jgi:hypothetical protein|nr:hypothetical protein [Syntrophomonadaceae bacterium]
MTPTTVLLYYIANVTHGCLGEWVRVEPTAGRTGRVVDAGRCRECWRTGYEDAAEQSFRERFLGKEVELPADFVGGWVEAALVDSAFELSGHRARATTVVPRELVVVDEAQSQA